MGLRNSTKFGWFAELKLHASKTENFKLCRLHSHKIYCHLKKTHKDKLVCVINTNSNSSALFPLYIICTLVINFGCLQRKASSLLISHPFQFYITTFPHHNTNEWTSATKCIEVYEMAAERKIQHIPGVWLTQTQAIIFECVHSHILNDFNVTMKFLIFSLFIWNLACCKRETCWNIPITSIKLKGDCYYYVVWAVSTAKRK